MPNLCLLIFFCLGCQGIPLLSDKHSFCFKFTVDASSELGNSWLKVDCLLDEKLLFEYNNVNKAELVGSIGEGNSIKVWEDVTQTVKEMGQEFRKRLLHIRPKTNNTKDHPELQVNMCCQREIEQNTGAFLLFNFNKQNLVLFDPNSMTWTELNPEARGVKRKLENDKELEKDLKKFSMGDCSHWLNELLKHRREISRPMVKTLNTVQMSPKSWDMNVIIIVVIIATVNLFLIGVVIFRNRIVSCIRGTRRGQHTPSAMGESHPEETICMNVMCSLEGDSPCCSSASSVI